jgi:signal transduction histidine kinase
MMRWILDRNWLSLSLYAAVLFLISAGFELVNENYFGLICSASIGAGIFFARKLPWISVASILVSTVLATTLSAIVALSTLEIGLITFAVFFFGERFQRAFGLIAGLLAAGFAGWQLGYQRELLVVFGNFSAEAELSKLNSFLLCFSMAALVFLAAAFSGRLVFLKLEHVGSPQDVALAKIRARKLGLEIAKQNERLEIAKDLSELLVQKISAVVSVTEGGRYAISSDPSSATRVLERSYEAGRSAQAELRRLYDYLNSAIISEVASFKISDLDELTVAFRELGYNAVLSEQGQSFSLNEGMELCVYKIVFEALQNVRKHAPLGTEIGIDFLWVEDGLQILVKDNGIEVSNRMRDGLGEVIDGYTAEDDLQSLVTEFDGATLAALRDRASIYKGRIEATRVPGVGFTLSAIFPNLKALATQGN